MVFWNGDQIFKRGTYFFFNCYAPLKKQGPLVENIAEDNIFYFQAVFR